MYTLRALSHTCRRLRASVLPLLWKIVHVDSVAEFGKIREAFRAAPHIARYAKCFLFRWHYVDFKEFVNYPAENGTLLDMAFCDRQRLREDRAKAEGRKIKSSEESSGSSNLQFIHIGSTDSILVRYDDTAHKVSESGPDGNGKDARIQSAEDFNNCAIEVISQLTSLETFGWDTPVTPLPLAAFNALAGLNTLTSLQFGISVHRGNLHACEHPRPVTQEAWF